MKININVEMNVIINKIIMKIWFKIYKFSIMLSHKICKTQMNSKNIKKNKKLLTKLKEF